VLLERQPLLGLPIRSNGPPTPSRVIDSIHARIHLDQPEPPKC